MQPEIEPPNFRQLPSLPHHSVDQRVLGISNYLVDVTYSPKDVLRCADRIHPYYNVNVQEVFLVKNTTQ